ncbi:Hypothetical protein I595_2191 [Croceitalea dokdonensis DOKDO 023]|uniref:Amino acid permease n=1 Tax=Croceitalea dokdonensis DOKDO 023 TaxID=1300341 RepID=A0A0P7AV17_9FLAO|nr:DUF3810 domain-containing protein [Croceitalea dokdonensis]KPM31696.1 Hypothetical protein I595_2191 [Croceitalea dokdonensis DOKDO 023]
MKKNLKTFAAFSILPQILLVKWWGNYPDLVEKYYSEGLYPVLSKFLRTLFGWIPFSVGDIFYTILVLSLLRYLWVRGKLLFLKPRETLQHVGITLSIAYFIFHLFWGMNYYRLPINEKLGFKTEYTKEELVNFTLNTVKELNYLQVILTQDSTVPVRIPYNINEIYKKTFDGYRNAATIFENLKYTKPSLKASIYSTPLTYMGYGGYLNPFTNEAQVNTIVPKLRLPSISAHEIGHQIGYSSESATNFIGLLVTYGSNDNYFKYASLFHVLGYCLSDLKKIDDELHSIIYNKLNSGVKINYQEIAVFWKQYQNPMEPVFKWIFDAFLKSNNQNQGIESYNAVVGLLVNFYKDYWIHVK